MNRLLAILLSIFCLSACAQDDVKPVYFYKASFDPVMVDAVAEVMKDISENRQFKLFEKDREEMKFLTEGKNSFFTAFYLKGKPILVLTNVGVGEVLTLSLHDNSKLPLDALEGLAQEVRNTLKNRFNIELQVADP